MVHVVGLRGGEQEDEAGNPRNLHVARGEVARPGPQHDEKRDQEQRGERREVGHEPDVRIGHGGRQQRARRKPHPARAHQQRRRV
jgi:hypothetical protein